jgi:hypothetical protein
MDQSNTPVPGLGARLRAARKARGLTQEALAAPEFTKSNSCLGARRQEVTVCPRSWYDTPAR